jgi:abortive infection bacteriophage resistance protein
MENKPKSVNALMKYLRDDKLISIQGSSDKQKLLNIGYYHGYKGYRYYKRPSNTLNYKSFNELLAVYNFDAHIKALFYPQVMKIETAMKGRILEELVSETKSDDFNVIYHNLLNYYKAFSTTGKSFNSEKAKDDAEYNFKKQLNKRLDLKDRINKIQTSAYSHGNKIANHYLSKDQAIPIWGIFELMTLGEFGTFVSCLNTSCRKNISRSLGFAPKDDTNGLLPQRIIYTIKDLRNAIAHNDVVFDTRFQTSEINGQISSVLENETGISGIDFLSITDYVILIAFILRKIQIPNLEIKRFVKDFSSEVEHLNTMIPVSLFNKIILTTNRAKLEKLLVYLQKMR